MVCERIRSTEERKNRMLNKIALILCIIGGLNWGSIGLFQFDLVAWICGGSATDLVHRKMNMEQVEIISPVPFHATDLTEKRVNCQ